MKTKSKKKTANAVASVPQSETFTIDSRTLGELINVDTSGDIAEGVLSQIVTELEVLRVAIGSASNLVLLGVVTGIAERARGAVKLAALVREQRARDLPARMRAAMVESGAD